MYFLKLNTHLNITPDHLSEIARQIEQWLTRNKLPFHWYLEEDDPIERLEDRISELEDTESELDDKVDRLENEIEDLKDTIERRDDTIEDLRTKLSALSE